MKAMMVPTQPPTLSPREEELWAWPTWDVLSISPPDYCHDQHLFSAEGGAGDNRKKLLMLSLGLLTASIALWFYAESMEASSCLLMLVLGGHSPAALSMCREHLTPRLGTC